MRHVDYSILKLITNHDQTSVSRGLCYVYSIMSIRQKLFGKIYTTAYLHFIIMNR